MQVRDAKPSDMATLTEYSETAVQILWCNDYWDGPLEGLAEVDGQRVLFNVVDRSAIGDNEEHRCFWLIALNSEQLAEEERWHELFCQNVGTHFDYTDRVRTNPEAHQHSTFYDAYAKRDEPDYSENTVLGWFQLG